MATDKNQVMVELYDLSITERKDDRFGRVVTGKSLNEDDLIKIAAARRTDLNPVTLRAALDIVNAIAVEEICNGASVSTGLAYFSLSVNGVFMGDNAQWDSTKHNLSVRIVPNARLRKAVQNTGVNVRGLAWSGTVINSVIDVASGQQNSRLTPGGGINISGSKIRVEGDKPEVGLKLVNQEDNSEVPIPTTSILVNNPSALTVIIPSDLKAGDYKLMITTQFAGTKTLLKEARSYEFEHILTVE